MNRLTKLFGPIATAIVLMLAAVPSALGRSTERCASSSIASNAGVEMFDAGLSLVPSPRPWNRAPKSAVLTAMIAGCLCSGESRCC